MPLAIGVTVVALILTTIPFIDILRQEKRGAAVKAQLVAFLEMEVAYVASLVALLLVANGYPVADPVVSIMVAIFIALSGVYLFRDNISFLIGEAPPREFMDRIKSTAFSVNGVLGVHDLIAEYIGPETVHTGFHIEVANGTPIEEADRIAEEVKEKVSRETGCRYCVIHIDPVNVIIPKKDE